MRKRKESRARFWLVVVVQSLSVQPYATRWIAGWQASLSFNISRCLLKLTSIELVMPFNHHPLSLPSPPALNHSQNQRLFQWVGSSHQVAILWSFSFSISPSHEYSGLISFRIDWYDLFLIQGILSIAKASIPRWSAFFMVQLSHP